MTLELKNDSKNSVNEVNKKVRLNWIDVAKGICILAVILGHMGETKIDNIVFAFHLTTFFVLSGYTLKTDKLDKNYAASKFKRLLIPYFVTCLCILLADIANLIIIKHIYSISVISTSIVNDLIRTFFASGSIKSFGNIVLPSRIGGIWFFPALFFALIICKLIINKVQRYRTRFGISLALAFIGMITAKYIWLPFSIQSAMFACPFIIFGKYLQECKILEKIKAKEIILFLVVFIFGYITNKNMISFATASMRDWIFTPIIGIISSIIIIKLSMFIEKSKVLKYIGTNSLYVLCTHIFLLECGGYYIIKLYNKLGIEPKIYFTVIIHVILCLIATAIINIIKNNLCNKDIKSIKIGKRDLTIDVIRAICIIAMIFGHCSINSGLRRFIFSFHMMAFIFLSGYLYKDNSDSLGKRLWKEIKRLIIPSLIFSIVYIIKNNYEVLDEVKTLLLGMSFSKNILTDIRSIGPYYFVLLLFVIKIIYICVSKLSKKTDEKNQWLIKTSLLCLGISVVGYTLGNKGYWLPWSIDVALYCIIFFHIGRVFREYDLISKLMERKYLYFVLTPIWVYMIYSGSMEIAIRKYNPFGLVIIGAICGILTIYIFADSISKRIGKIGNKITELIGSSTIYILIIHTIFNGDIVKYIDNLGFDKKNIYNLIISILIQIVAGVIINSVIIFIKNKIQKIKLSMQEHSNERNKANKVLY